MKSRERISFMEYIQCTEKSAISGIIGNPEFQEYLAILKTSLLMFSKILVLRGRDTSNIIDEISFYTDFDQ